MDIGKQIGALKRMTVKQLRRKYAEVFGRETTVGHRVFLIKRIIWQMQANEYGGLSEGALRRAEELSRDLAVRIRPLSRRLPLPDPTAASRTVRCTVPVARDRRLPMVGTVLTREFHGRVHQVMVLEHGFEHEGKVYRSLSAVARVISGGHWNGYGFFLLHQKGSETT